MPMMALALSTRCNDGQALDAAVQFRLHLRLRLRLRLCLNLHLCLRLRRTIFLGDYEECTDEKNNYRAGEFWWGVIFRCIFIKWIVTG